MNIPKIGTIVRTYDGKDEKIRGYLVYHPIKGVHESKRHGDGKFVAVITETGGALDLAEIKSK